MSRIRSSITVLVLSFLLIATIGCASPVDPEAAALATAEAQLAGWNPGVGSKRLPNSFEEYVLKTPVIVVGTVTEVGPYFNSNRAGDGMDTGPFKGEYAFTQVCVIKVEQYLKGTGPDTIRTTQVEAMLPGNVPVNKATIQVARSKYTYDPIVVGSRYLFFLGLPDRVPELGNLEFWPGNTTPSRYLLEPDGVAQVSQGGAPSKQLRDLFPDRPAIIVIGDVEQIVNGLGR